ncbi:MAG: PhnD/SsuA/transferrin family substrate-binding protein [bacterium]
MEAKRGAVISVILFLVLSMTSPALFAVNRSRKADHFIFALNLPPSFLNKGSATIIDLYNRFRKILRRKTGYDVELKTYRDWGSVVSALEKGEADFAGLPAYFYAMALNNPRSDIAPFLVYQSHGRISSSYCIYARKESGFLSVDHLLNARVAVADEDDWVMLNLLFKENDQPIPAIEFLEKVEVLPRESAFLAVLFNKIDAVVMDSVSMEYILKGNRRGSEVVPIECSATLTNSLIVRRGGVGKQVLEKLEKVLIQMHADRDFKDFKEFFQVTDGRWVSGEKMFYSDWLLIIDEAKKNNWSREFLKIKKAAKD